jgi:hypothetical protein
LNVTTCTVFKNQGVRVKRRVTTNVTVVVGGSRRTTAFCVSKLDRYRTVIITDGFVGIGSKAQIPTSCPSEVPIGGLFSKATKITP